MTNIPIDPALVQQVAQALPDSWNHYVPLAFSLLMIAGRVGMVIYKGGGLVSIVKSVLFGSAHAVPGTSVSQEVTLKTEGHPPEIVPVVTKNT